MDFVIDPEIESLLNPLTTEEYSNLEASIAVDGCREAGIVAVLPDGAKILADGHHRGRICADFDIDFKTVEKSFPDRESLILWVINNQFGRRNLTEERKAYYRGKEYLETRKTVGKPNCATVAQLESDDGTTAEKVAKKHGVSPRTVHHDADYAAAVDALPKEEAEIVLSGKSGQTKKAIAGGAKPKPRCERCTRTGKTDPECPQCVEVRKPKKEAEVKPPVVEAETEPEKATVDGWGIPIAPHAKAAFADVGKFDELLKALFHVRQMFSDLVDSPGGAFLQRPSVAINKRKGWTHQGIENAINAIKDNKPKYTCCPNQWSEAPGYKHGKDCQTCYGVCWIPDIDETTISPETIAKAKADGGVKRV